MKKQVKSKKNKVKNNGYKPPKWFMSIPYGSHGNTPTQKRLWWVISQKYREDDFKKYRGKCVSCDRVLADWKDGDLAHFKKYSVCNSWFKFERKNLALSCKKCNSRDDGVVGHAFGEELKRRYGAYIIDWIQKTNICFHGQKIEDWKIVEMVERIDPSLIK